MAYRASVTNSGVDSQFTSPSCGYPTVSANDILLLSVVSDGTVTLTTPSGWTLLQSIQSTADNQTQSVYRKVATGSESGSLTIASSQSGKAFVCIMGSWSGRNTTTPETFSTANNSNAGNASPITVVGTGGTAAAGDDIAWFGEIDQETATDTWSFAAPTGYTSRQNVANASWVSHGLSSKDAASAGATGSISAVATRTAGTDVGGWTCIVVSLAAGGGTQSFSYTMAGGLTFAGAAAHNYLRQEGTRTGGLQFGGSAAQARVVNEGTRSGGLQFGGTAAQSRVANEGARSGGLSFAGTAAEIRVAARGASGGVLFGGSAGYSSTGHQSFSYTMAGGVSFGGIAARAFARNVVGSGGLQFGGAASYSTHVAAIAVTMSGGIRFAGSAPVSFVGAGVNDRRIYWQWNQALVQRYYRLPEDLRRLH